MKTQTPATGIMQTSEYKDSRSFRIACMCHDSAHDVDAWIDVSPESDGLQAINVGFYIETETPWWADGFSRIRLAWDILVHGRHTQGHTLMLNEQTALNFADALLKSIGDFSKSK